MRSGGAAIPAGGIGKQAPEVVASDGREMPWFRDVLNPRNEYPGGTTVVTDDLCLVGDGLDDLFSLFPAVVARCPVLGEDEPVRHV
jgi:hypothetical protein